ncbi:MAG: DUF4175 domain-containing protein, partial [Myxococcota bacterium]
MTPTPSSRLTHLATLWERASGPWRGRVLLATLAAAVVVGAHVARLGTPTARLASGAVLAVIVAAWWASGWWVRRRDANPARLARKVARVRSRDLGAKAERAVRLVGAADTSRDPLSAGLARVHLEKLLAQVHPEDIWEACKRRASLWRKVVLVLVALGLGAFAVGPLRVVEGLNVWLAYDGRAPLSLQWVEAVFCEAQPPSYIGQRSRVFMGFVDTEQPVGTTLRVHAAAKYEGRALVLTDGTSEVPFAEDGRGGVVATWKVMGDAELQVAARFGQVLIAQSDALRVEA